jgi:glycosyltransferase involved in cell wall biosynthesis
MIDQVLNPKISIIITCYNYGKFIEDAVSSVIRQTFSDYEVIIIDDCSTDQFTIGKIKELHQLYENNNKFNLILLPKNIGVCGARNLATKKARGEYILYLDADDMIEKTCLSKMYSKMVNNNYDIVGCLSHEFNKKISYLKPKNNMIFKFSNRNFDKFKFCFKCQISITSLFKKEIWDRVGGFRENMKNGAEDYDFWLGAVEGGANVFILQERLLFYRRSHDSRSNNNEECFDLVVKNNYKLYHWFVLQSRNKISKYESNARRFKRTSLLLGFINILLIFYLLQSK